MLVSEILLPVYSNMVNAEKFSLVLVGVLIVLVSFVMSRTKRPARRNGMVLIYLSMISRLAVLSLLKPSYAVV